MKIEYYIISLYFLGVFVVFLSSIFCMSDRKEIRNKRYRFFRQFINREKSDSYFKRIGKYMRGHDFFEGEYSFCVCPGGRNGALDDRCLEVFYGSRPIYDFNRVSGGGFPPKIEYRLATEEGSTLGYYRADSGRFNCVLLPAKSEFEDSVEKFLILHNALDSKLLVNDRFLKRDFRYLLAYFECTSLDGKPSFGQRLLVWWLRSTRLVARDDDRPKREVTAWLRGIATWVVTIGLSGSILMLLERFSSK